MKHGITLTRPGRQQKNNKEILEYLYINSF